MELVQLILLVFFQIGRTSSDAGLGKKIVKHNRGILE